MVVNLPRHTVLGFQFGALRDDSHFGEAQEDEAEASFRTSTMGFRFGKMGCRHCLLSGVPEALLSAAWSVSILDGAIQVIIHF